MPIPAKPLRVWVATVVLLASLGAPSQAGQRQATFTVSATIQASVVLDLTALPIIARANGQGVELPAALAFSCTRGVSPRLVFSRDDRSGARPDDVVTEKRSQKATLVYFSFDLGPSLDLARDAPQSDTITVSMEF